MGFVFHLFLPFDLYLLCSILYSSLMRLLLLVQSLKRFVFFWMLEIRLWFQLFAFWSGSRLKCYFGEQCLTMGSNNWGQSLYAAGIENQSQQEVLILSQVVQKFRCLRCLSLFQLFGRVAWATPAFCLSAAKWFVFLKQSALWWVVVRKLIDLFEESQIVWMSLALTVQHCSHSCS